MPSKPTRLVNTPKAMKELATKILTTNISRKDRAFNTFRKEIPTRDLEFLYKDKSTLDIVVYAISHSSSPILAISSDVIYLPERKGILDSYLKSHNWGLLEMFLLLTDEIVEFDVNGGRQMESNEERPYNDYPIFLLSLLRSRCPKLRFLSLSGLSLSRHSVYELCEILTRITHLDLSLTETVDDDDDNDRNVLQAIASSMPNLTSFDISGSKLIIGKHFESLLPTEENPSVLSKLVFLNLWKIRSVTVAHLKKIILAFPKLRCLKHELFVNALVELTDREMGVDTARCLKHLRGKKKYDGDPIRYADLLIVPVFPRLDNITVVDIAISATMEASLERLLMPLKKLKTIILHNLESFHTALLPVLEENGRCLEYLYLFSVAGNFGIENIKRTCPALQELSLECQKGTFSNNDDQTVRKSEKQHFFHGLKKLTLENVTDQMCNKKTLVSLLLSSQLEAVSLTSVEAMSDAVMMNVLEASDVYAPLSEVRKFLAQRCNVSAAPFVRWLKSVKVTLESLQLMCCPLVDKDVLLNVATKYPRDLLLEVGHVSDCNAS